MTSYQNQTHKVFSCFSLFEFMKGDALGYIVMMWIHLGPNLNLNAEHLRNVCKYGLKWPSFKHMLLHSLTDTCSSGLSGYINQMFWLHLKDSEYLICN